MYRLLASVSETPRRRIKMSNAATEFTSLLSRTNLRSTFMQVSELPIFYSRYWLLIILRMPFLLGGDSCFSPLTRTLTISFDGSVLGLEQSTQLVDVCRVVLGKMATRSFYFNITSNKTLTYCCSEIFNGTEYSRFSKNNH